jgi:hypothetical protein
MDRERRRRVLLRLLLGDRAGTTCAALAPGGAGVVSMIALSGRRGKGQFTMLDDQDAELVLGCRWHLTSGGYASNGSRGRGYMHRFLLGLELGDQRQGDHINGDRLDNRRSNLRILTGDQNMQNLRRRGGTSQYRGVHWAKNERKWCAQISKNGRGIALGYFDDELAAARAAQDARLKLMPYAVEDVIA